MGCMLGVVDILIFGISKASPLPENVEQLKNELKEKAIWVTNVLSQQFGAWVDINQQLKSS